MKEAGGIPFLSCLRAGVLEKMHLLIHTYVFIILDDVGGRGVIQTQGLYGLTIYQQR